MDIAGISMALSQMKIGQQVSISVAKLAMDSSKQSMEDLSKTMQQSVQPHLGKSIDIKL